MSGPLRNLSTCPTALLLLNIYRSKLKFKIKTEDLKKVVSTVSRIVDPRPAAPALQGIYFRTTEGSVEVIGSDLDIVIRAKTKAEVEIEGKALINARVLSEMVRKLPRGEVTFSDIGSELRVEQNKLNFTLRKLDEETYPEALLSKNYDEEKSQTIEPNDLFESLKKVGIAASPEGGRPILTGVYFNNEDEKTEIAATDSYRLTTHDLTNFPIKDAGILSFRSLNETAKIFEQTEEKIQINSTERELYFYDDQFTVSIRKLEGTFPEYGKLFPKENLFSVEVKKNEIIEALDRATVVAEGFIPVKIEILDTETLKITTINKDIGGGNEEVSIKILGLDVGDTTGFTMSFNPNYLIQGIEVLDGNTVYMRFSGNEKPVVIQGEHETFRYLLMPVRPN
ncbi:MAG: DNA polymerase III subunit beta [Candidatus Actinomarinales bacterium MED-G02]|nr:MAG: DNA polymerase III subunit beta [Candidatus Actinomarinales bacterium MED-G02]